MATATIAFGLVSIPVKLYASTESSEAISFRLLHKKCKTPLKRPYYCPTDQAMVPSDEIMKGYEYTKDQFVIVTDEEIKGVEQEVTKAIDINEFVPLADVDPVYFDRAYYLGPDKGGERSYKLLALALKKMNLAGVAQYAVRGKSYLVCVRPLEEGLVMQQMLYANEVRPFSDVQLDDRVQVKDAELKLALQLIEQTASEKFDPGKYEDAVKTRLREIIQQKVEGEEVTFAPGEAPKAQVLDLMEALKASLESVSGSVEGEMAASPGKSAKPSPQKAARKAGSRSGKKMAAG